ncbi:MAG: flagellar hook-associated protein FlgK [Phycisphaerae bacterium]|nr:flagellar hook-associated protein FlgK [Phycisphaerae bacterium]
MSLINGSLQIGQSALRASQAALQIVGNNVANASNADYTRQRVVVEPATAGNDAGSGVKLAGIERLANEAVNARVRTATSDNASANALADELAQVETVLNALGDDNISNRFTTFFNAFNALANDPQSSSQRSMVLQAGTSLAAAFGQADQALRGQRVDLDNQVLALVDESNRLVNQVATLNSQITAAEAGSEAASASTLRDQRDSALRQLAELLNVQTHTSGNGAINVFLGSTPLVLGTESFALRADDDPASPRGGLTLASDATGQPVSVTAGQIGGLLAARTGTLDVVADQLDALAGALIDQVNRLHA